MLDDADADVSLRLEEAEQVQVRALTPPAFRNKWSATSGDDACVYCIQALSTPRPSSHPKPAPGCASC